MNNDFPRLSRLEMHILGMLISNGEMYGLEMVKASDQLKRGTVYVTLRRMEDKGYIKSREVAIKAGERGLPRRKYRPSGLGERVHAAWALLSEQLAAI